MFIEKLQHPTIELDPSAGQLEPTLVHYLSSEVEPLKSALPVLAGAEEAERVLVVASPLSELADETIRLHRHPDHANLVVVDEKHRAFFEGVKQSLLEAVAKIDRIEYAALDEDGKDGEE